MRGRSKKNPEIISKILALIRGAVPTEAACAMAGLPRPTWYDWMSKDEELKTQYQEAVAASEATLVLEIKKDLSWQSKAWLLERRFPERWRKREEVSQNNKTDQTIRLVWGDEQDAKKEETKHDDTI